MTVLYFAFKLNVLQHELKENKFIIKCNVDCLVNNNIRDHSLFANLCVIWFMRYFLKPAERVKQLLFLYLPSMNCSCIVHIEVLVLFFLYVVVPTYVV